MERKLLHHFFIISSLISLMVCLWLGFVNIKTLLTILLFTMFPSFLVVFYFSIKSTIRMSVVSKFFNSLAVVLFLGVFSPVFIFFMTLSTTRYYKISRHRGYFIPTKEKHMNYMRKILSGEIQPFTDEQK